MTGRHLAVALALGLFATSAAADNAVRRGGSSSGGSRDTGSRHTPGMHGSGGSSRSGGGGSSWSSGDRGSSRDLTPAQRRQPRPGTGTGGRRGYGYYYPRFYYPGYYGGLYGYGYGWPYGSFYYGGGYYPYAYGPYGGSVYHRYYGDRGSLRLLVDPSKARVYVDGYYAGVVDDFDGLFQRLHVSPGRHEIGFRLEGYQSHRVKVYVASGATLKIHYDLREGSGPETFEDLAGDVDERYTRRDDRYDRRSREAGEEDVDEGRSPRGEEADMGRLRLTVRPEDASVYVDGQFRGSGRQVASIELPPGRHRVEVVRPGFRTEERDVEVEPGATREMEVELQRP
ncbi:MAG TPA: PEGA domain-containing protein [Vicinamibacteria bacterium]|nr:PEGA domain-containing protein [Vicinamibacteria bacterium]